MLDFERKVRYMSNRIEDVLWSNVVFMAIMYMSIGSLDKRYVAFISVVALISIAAWLAVHHALRGAVAIIAIDALLITMYYLYRSDYYSLQIVTAMLVLLVALTGKTIAIFKNNV